MARLISRCAAAAVAALLAAGCGPVTTTPRATEPAPAPAKPAEPAKPDAEPAKKDKAAPFYPG